MADGAPSRTKHVAVALSLADGSLRDRLVAAIDRDDGLRPASLEDADVVVADVAGLGRGPQPIILVGDTEPDDLSSWVRAMLPSDASPRLILAAVELVAAGFEVLPDQTSLAGEDLEPSLQRRDHDPSPAPGLTPREKQVLRLLADGASNKLIARRLDLSVHTAKFHVASLLRKLGAQSRLEAVGIGVRLGLVLV